jgi:hypothetical protein
LNQLWKLEFIDRKMVKFWLSLGQLNIQTTQSQMMQLEWDYSGSIWINRMVMISLQTKSRIVSKRWTFHIKMPSSYLCQKWGKEWRDLSDR